MQALVGAANRMLPVPALMMLRRLALPIRHPEAAQRRRRRLELFRRAGRPAEVQSGPFRGMRYGLGDGLRNPLPYLLGTYELELRPAIDALRAHDPDVIVDVGAADGFYAVGLARLIPRATVLAFETLRTTKHYLARNAAANGVTGRVLDRWRCDVPALRSALAGAKRPAVISDCEGYEDTLLDPGEVPDLQRALIVVEVHEGFVEPGLHDRLRARFGATHAITELHGRPRTVADRPEGCPLSDAEFLEAVNEERDIPALWFLMTPHA